MRKTSKNSASGKGRATRTAATTLIRQWMKENAKNRRYNDGVSYAKNGRVRDVEYGHDGSVLAYVRGSQLQPFSIVMMLPPRTPDKLRPIATRLVEVRAHYKRRVALTKKEAEVLLWADTERPYMQCSCPDSAVPCKHIVAVAENLIEDIEDSPEVILRLRGMSLDTLVDFSDFDGVDPWDGGAHQTGCQDMYPNENELDLVDSDLDSSAAYPTIDIGSEDYAIFEPVKRMPGAPKEDDRSTAQRKEVVLSAAERDLFWNTPVEGMPVIPNLAKINPLNRCREEILQEGLMSVLGSAKEFLRVRSDIEDLYRDIIGYDDDSRDLTDSGLGTSRVLTVVPDSFSD